MVLFDLDLSALRLTQVLRCINISSVVGKYPPRTTKPQRYKFVTPDNEDTTMSRFFYVTVWADNAPAPVATYMRKCIGKTSTVHDRLTRNAMRKFPNWSRIEVEVQS